MLDEIAAFAGCTCENVRKIESVALRKLRLSERLGYEVLEFTGD